MKLFSNKFAMFLPVAALLAATAWAHPAERAAARFSDEQLDVIETNLIAALTSASPGMQTSAANVIRQVKTLAPAYTFSRSVVPLMGILKSTVADPAARVVAALALHDLHSSMGDYAIEREATFTDVAKVQHICSWLHYYRMIEEQTN